MEEHRLPLYLGTRSENVWTIFFLGCFFIKNFLQNWYILNQYGTDLSISRHATIEVTLLG